MTDPRACPVCSSNLDVVAHEGVDVDRCPDGHGVWLDRGELRAVVTSEAADRPVHDEEAALQAGTTKIGQAVMADAARDPLPCPVCRTPMRVVEYGTSGIAIDECVQHGAWLDAGELERIEAYAEGLRRAARPGAARGGIAGIDVPADLLATIRTVGVAPPR